MNIKTLQGIGLEQLSEAFNKAFAKYFVPINMTPDILREKMHNDRIFLELSVGVFEGNELGGLVLDGYDELDGQMQAYNAATGVLPQYRGNRLTWKLYEFILPVLKQQKVERCVLEVIDKNAPAIKTYESIGFSITRELPCFKGGSGMPETRSAFEIKPINRPDWSLFQTFWDVKPTWQNDIQALSKVNKDLSIIGLYQEQQLIGYTAFNLSNGRIRQMAVHPSYRRRGGATQLFNHIRSLVKGEVSAINVDSDAKHALGFLKAMGLTEFIRQYEMEFILISE